MGSAGFWDERAKGKYRGLSAAAQERASGRDDEVGGGASVEMTRLGVGCESRPGSNLAEGKQNRLDEGIEPVLGNVG
jgi:hypothetical protein